jgi:hypothetical protein
MYGRAEKRRLAAVALYQRCKPTIVIHDRLRELEQVPSEILSSEELDPQVAWDEVNAHRQVRHDTLAHIEGDRDLKARSRASLSFALGRCSRSKASPARCRSSSAMKA